MILVDKDILEYVKNKQLIIGGFEKENLGGISYDLTIDEIVGCSDSSKNTNKYSLSPGEAVFIKSKEELLIPENILGRVAQKNSRMRMGLYVDGPHYHPGHRTYAYLRVQNMGSNLIEIKKGDKIAQIIFEQTTRNPEKIYNDRQRDAFVDEVEFKGLSSYKKEYLKAIKKVEKVRNDIDNKETQIYANVLTLMGIIAAVFAIITINFEAFKQTQLDLKFMIIMNLSLAFTITVFFGLLYLVTSKQKKKGFSIIYILLLILVASAAISVYIFM